MVVNINEHTHALEYFRIKRRSIRHMCFNRLLKMDVAIRECSPLNVKIYLIGTTCTI